MKFKLNKRVISLLSFFLISLTTYINVNADPLTRSQIENTSDQPWKVKFLFSNGTLNTALSECKAMDECTIAPHSQKAITYESHSSWHGLKGIVILTDDRGTTTYYDISQDNVAYPNDPWITPEDNRCPNAFNINVTYSIDGRTSAGYYNAGGGIQILKDFCK